MQGPNAVLNVITIPPGALLGQRIVIDGVRGAIFEYSSTNALVSSWAAMAGTDPFGNAYPAGFSIGSGSVFEGTDFIINSSGIFIYSGTPALGNLIGSWAGTAGSDSFGNSYPQGFSITMGAISGTTFTGTDYVLNSHGFFLYSGTPALGNLIVALANAAGSDSFGNTWPQGAQVWGANGVPVGLTMPTRNPDETAAAFIASGVTNPGIAGEFIYLEMVSPQITGASEKDQVAIFLESSTKATPNSAQGDLVYITSGGVTTEPLIWGATGIFVSVPFTIDNQSLPGTPGNGAALFGFGGHLKYVATDNSAYNTGIQHLILSANQTVNSVTPAGIGGITGINVNAAKYIIRGAIFYNQGAVASAQSIIITGPATTVPTRVTFNFQQIAAATSGNWQQNNVINSIQNSPAFAAAANFYIFIEGCITFTAAAATFGLQAACTVAADTFTVIAGSYLDLMPAT